MKYIIPLLLFASVARSQVDSAITIPLLGIHISGQLPYGDLSDRFGPNLTLGGSFMVKTKKSWIYGIESNYLFGRNVREDVLKQLKTKEGTVTDNLGNPADIRVTERGAGVHLFAGRLFKVGSQNPNSGLIITLGVGGLQHKIKIFDPQQSVAAVKGSLVYGFDRLTAGVSITEFVGYLFISENRLVNFYFGFESYQAFTRSIRKLNYDTGMPDTQKRFDGLAGFRFGWILPLYKKTPDDFYYY